MNKNIESDLKRCLSLIKADWKMQNNVLDKRSNFIYRCDTLDKCIQQIELTGVEKEYTLHRWYNFMTSIACEYIFCEYGAIHDEDVYNHDVDIYINGIPFDVKLTIYPAKLAHRPFDLKTRIGKNEMIRWYYKNQSQQSRKQMLNRLYVVCDGKDSYECLAMKSDFTILRKKISVYMEHIAKNGINEIEIEDNGITFSLQSDIIYISYD